MPTLGIVYHMRLIRTVTSILLPTNSSVILLLIMALSASSNCFPLLQLHRRSESSIISRARNVDLRAKDSLKLQNMALCRESSDVMFPCGIEGCERTFSRKDNLKQHIKRSHGGDHVSGRFVCCVGDCKVAFYQKWPHRSFEDQSWN